MGRKSTWVKGPSCTGVKITAYVPHWAHTPLRVLIGSHNSPGRAQTALLGGRLRQGPRTHNKLSPGVWKLGRHQHQAAGSSGPPRLHLPTGAPLQTALPATSSQPEGTRTRGSRQNGPAFGRRGKQIKCLRLSYTRWWSKSDGHCWAWHFLALPRSARSQFCSQTYGDRGDRTHPVAPAVRDKAFQERCEPDNRTAARLRAADRLWRINKQPGPAQTGTSDSQGEQGTRASSWTLLCPQERKKRKGSRRCVITGATPTERTRDGLSTGRARRRRPRR